MSLPDASSHGNQTDQMRVSDGERQVVVEQLAQAQAAGQLGPDEFDERTSRAHAARTYGDLQPLTADLSGTAPIQPPVSTAPSSTPAPALAGAASHYRSKAEVKSAARHGDPDAARKIFYGVLSSWVFMSVISTIIWVLGDRGSFWPAWVMIGLGFGVFGAFRNWKMQ
ncbi:MAG: DUF1707 domain-containing protein [Antricoccus sp.]